MDFDVLFVCMIFYTWAESLGHHLQLCHQHFFLSNIIESKWLFLYHHIFFEPTLRSFCSSASLQFAGYCEFNIIFSRIHLSCFFSFSFFLFAFIFNAVSSLVYLDQLEHVFELDKNFQSLRPVESCISSDLYPKESLPLMFEMQTQAIMLSLDSGLVKAIRRDGLEKSMTHFFPSFQENRLFTLNEIKRWK